MQIAERITMYSENLYQYAGILTCMNEYVPNSKSSKLNISMIFLISRRISAGAEKYRRRHNKLQEYATQENPQYCMNFSCLLENI